MLFRALLVAVGVVRPVLGLICSDGFTCFEENPRDPNGVVWVMKNSGNTNGPNCKDVCEEGLPLNCAFYVCDEGRPVVPRVVSNVTQMLAIMDQFSSTVAKGLGFTCRRGSCFWPDSVSSGILTVSIATAADGSKTCFFPAEPTFSCNTNPGNGNCFGERYSSVCPCVKKPLDQACQWSCGPQHTTRAVWKTNGTSCLERVNYWRKRACEDGWVECPPAGLPPMVECTACHECTNSQAEFDLLNGAHKSFTRCGDFVQGEGGGRTCADVIDSFVSERAPDANGVVRCQGHCGPIVSPGCQTFHWGKAQDPNGFTTLNWRSCNVAKCQGYCANASANPCFTVATATPTTCDDPNVNAEANPSFPCRGPAAAGSAPVGPAKSPAVGVTVGVVATVLVVGGAVAVSQARNGRCKGKAPQAKSVPVPAEVLNPTATTATVTA